LIAGIGGTGIVTLGAILGMAAHLEQRACTVLDVTGLAQKNGPVLSQVRLAPTPERLHALRIGPGQANLLLGCDIVVASGAATLATLGKGSTRAVVNSHLQPTAAFVMDGDVDFQQDAMQRSIANACGEGQVEFIPATQWATSLAGDAIATNMFMLGYAFQKGLLPLQLRSLVRAIELNGAAVEEAKRTFSWGRKAAADPAQVTAMLAVPRAAETARPRTLSELIAFHAAHLVAYQDEQYAERYRSIVEKLAEAERVRAGGHTGLADAVARNLAKLMAYKDEYEVARLYTDGRFQDIIDRTFEGRTHVQVHLAPPWLARRDRDTGRPVKRAYGPWILPVLSFLGRMKWLRGSVMDPFAYSRERRLERRLIADYEALIAEIAGSLMPDNHAIAVALAELPERIRGFGHIKEKNALAAKASERDLLRRFHDVPSVTNAAA
jgi:indolepyruvate ferredoxin oxidoreductase